MGFQCRFMGSLIIKTLQGELQNCNPDENTRLSGIFYKDLPPHQGHSQAMETAQGMWAVQMDLELLCAFITVIWSTIWVSAFRRGRPKFDPNGDSSATSLLLSCLKAVCSAAATPVVAPGERITGVDQKREAHAIPAFERTDSAFSSADTPNAHDPPIQDRRVWSDCLSEVKRSAHLRPRNRLPAEGGVPDSGPTTARARSSSSDPSTSRAKVFQASQPSAAFHEKVREWLLRVQSNAESRTGGSSTRLSRTLSDGANQVGPATLQRGVGSQARGPGLSAAGKRRTKNSSDRPGSSPAARPSTKARDTTPNAPATAPEQTTDSSEEAFAVLPFGPLRRPVSQPRPVSLPRSKSFERMMSNDREVPMTPLPLTPPTGRLR